SSEIPPRPLARRRPSIDPIPDSSFGLSMFSGGHSINAYLTAPRWGILPGLCRAGPLSRPESPNATLSRFHFFAVVLHQRPMLLVSGLSRPQRLRRFDRTSLGSATPLSDRTSRRIAARFALATRDLASASKLCFACFLFFFIAK